MTSTPFRCLVLGLMVLASASAPSAQGKQTASIRVTEASGIRRTEYPVHARVAVPQRALADASQAQLRLNEMAVPAQVTVIAKWPDGSAQSIDVDFNVSLAPAESRTYQLDYGPSVAGAVPRGLAVTEEADVIQIGSVKWTKSGAPLIASATYVRAEFIGQFAQARNGFVIVDKAGARHELASATPLKAELLKRGPLSAVLQYSGSIPFDAGYAVPFTLTIEMPNSKSWVRMSASVTDPASRVRDLDFDTPFSLGAFPWLWDFATENGSYGVLRNANDTVVFTQIVEARPQGSNSWKIDTGAQAELRPLEASVKPATPTAADRAHVTAGWGHLQSPTQAVAFAVDGMGESVGTYTVTLNGQGQATYRFSPGARPIAATPLHFTVYQHFVSVPVPIGAATTPTSMLHAPVVEVLTK